MEHGKERGPQMGQAGRSSPLGRRAYRQMGLARTDTLPREINPCLVRVSSVATHFELVTPCLARLPIGAGIIEPVPREGIVKSLTVRNLVLGRRQGRRDLPAKHPNRGEGRRVRGPAVPAMLAVGARRLARAPAVRRATGANRGDGADSFLLDGWNINIVLHEDRKARKVHAVKLALNVTTFTVHFHLRRVRQPEA